MSDKTVLIVEDDSFNLMLMRELLAGTGLRTLEAGSADEALDVAGADPPDLVLMDIQLRGSCGLQATRRLRCLPALAAMPIVAVTALTAEDDRARMRAAGCDGIVPKPIDPDIFLAAVARALTPARLSAP